MSSERHDLRRVLDLKDTLALAFGAMVFVYGSVCAFEAVALPTVIQYWFPDYRIGHLWTIAGWDVHLSWAGVMLMTGALFAGSPQNLQPLLPGGIAGVFLVANQLARLENPAFDIAEHAAEFIGRQGDHEIDHRKPGKDLVEVPFLLAHEPRHEGCALAQVTAHPRQQEATRHGIPRVLLCLRFADD